MNLARKVQDSRDRGWNDVESLTEFNRLLPNTDIDNLCNSDLSVETIVDICLGEKDTTRILTREELLELVKRFTSPGSNRFATEAESTLAVLTFNSNCKHSAGSDLIFYPQEHFDGRSNPTAEEIVEKALRGEWGQLNGGN